MNLKFVPTNEVLDEALSETNDPEGHYSAAKMANLIKAALRDLNLWVIPSFRTDDFTVTSNSTVNMPGDCIRPILVYKRVLVNGKRVLYQYGRKDTLKPGDTYKCLDEDAPGTIAPLSDITGENYENWVYHPEYQEEYGDRVSMFWGHWTYWPDDQYIELSNVKAGDVFTIIYDSDNHSYRKVPVDAVSMVKYMALSNFWRSTDVVKAREYWMQFRTHLRMFKKYRLDGWSYEDWIDAFVSEYTPTAR